MEKYVGGKVEKILERKRWQSVLFIFFQEEVESKRD